ncbi:hypothetical protein CAPTEDRAFT_156783 [Capitella teleta]|uniref:Suppressor of fused homolog n=1 Tax=Capitella teleta TaxID=283909 RepID=R7USC7_CAPTE|nr:hypothetical protein CAPTEDRAFT_156783 [Capitella teleta]|eukprot:ELU09419.1 hypothetical protein CAPTEDRAFT_156783 [Capitella teleta]
MKMEQSDSTSQNLYPQAPLPVTPPGLHAIYSACRKLYQDQPNPLQVTAVRKYWLGGPDPLDYISMYANPGDAERDIPPHWHYVSFGLSDLHGDGRVHECTGPQAISGFGFELTFRLKREPEETAPPTWPAALMQALARYVFQSENTLCVGDHVPWHSPLDGSESRIQHMLMTEDPQLRCINSPFGTVTFVQIVGVCAEELKAAQHWNGSGVSQLMSAVNIAGGVWLITDMRRGETIFDLNPQLQEEVDQGIEIEGSNLSGVTSCCSWEQLSDYTFSGTDENKENEADRRLLSQSESDQIRAALKNGLNSSLPVLPPIIPVTDEHLTSHPDARRNNSSRKESIDSCLRPETPSDILRTRSIEGVHLKLNLEAGSLLPLAVKGRLRHGRHFTFKSVMNDVAVTLVSNLVVGSIVDEHNPYAAHGPWLQILLMDDFMEDFMADISELTHMPDSQLPKTYQWPSHKLTITILADEV